MIQPELFHGVSSWGRFLAYHQENPKVYQLFEMFALKAIASGRKHYSARTILERIRWHTEVETTGDEFKINNNHTPYYSRLFEQAHPEHKGFFRNRVIRSP